MRPLYTLLSSSAWAVVLLAAGPVTAAPGDSPVAAPPQAQKSDDKLRTRLTSLPAKGLFQGEQLTDAAKSKLVELIIEARGLDVEVALLIPTGPWQIDGSGANERDLTPARLATLRKFLTDRGVDQKRIFVESRIDAKIKEPRLDVQLVGQPAND